LLKSSEEGEGEEGVIGHAELHNGPGEEAFVSVGYWELDALFGRTLPGFIVFSSLKSATRSV